MRRPPHPWQWAVADVAGELNDDRDGWHYDVVVLSVPRRAGKSTVTLAANLGALDITDSARCWYTAQTREHAAKLYRDEWVPMLSPLDRLYRLRKSQGSEGVHKRRGSSRLQLFAPTANALHSTNADTVTVDEAWAFDIDAGEAVESGIRPAQLTRPWRQRWIVSAGGTIESTWWDRWLCMGEARTPRVALFDFGADPTAGDYDPGDPATWLRSHPVATDPIVFAALQTEWDTRTDDAAFERANLNVWPRPSQLAAAGAGLDVDLWAAAGDGPAALPRHAFALDVSADRSRAAIAAAAVVDDRVLVEIVDARPGLGWIARAVRELRAQHPGVPVVADSLVAASIIAELNRGHTVVEPLGASDHGRACGTFVDLLDGRLRHRSQAVLDDAVAGAARRPLGDAWLWSRSRSDVDISPLVAATLAVVTAYTRRRVGRPAVVTGAGAATPAALTPAGRSPAARYLHTRQPGRGA